MAANYELVLLHGPKYCGRDMLYQMLTSPAHERLCPLDYFKDDTIGLRDVILQVISLLKKNKKVVVDDENASATTRESYVRMVQRKISSKGIACVKVLPRHGKKQLLWAREYELAENAAENVQSSPTLVVQDGEINKWFTDDDDGQVRYCHSIVTAPCENEGMKVFEKTIPLSTRLQYKFEVPALFMQWEGVVNGDSDNPRLRPEIVTVCQQWSEVNMGGRIFVVSDSIHVKSGTPGKQVQEYAGCRRAMRKLISQFDGCPVYMFCMENSSDSGGFSLPPNPGILAYLQKRHHLNIHSKTSVYLYQTPNHKTMADAAGLPNIKISRVLHQPSLITSSHVFSVPAIPSFLKDMDILPPVSSEKRSPEIPGFSRITSFQENMIIMDLGYGRKEILFAKDTDSVIRFNQKYGEMASLSTDSISKFTSVCSIEEVSENDGEKHDNTLTKVSLSKSFSSDRELPQWMLSEKKKKGTSEDTEVTNIKQKKTMYVMTESELEEIATDILKQAGREDILRSIELQKIGERSTNKTDKRTKGSSPRSHRDVDIDDTYSPQTTKHGYSSPEESRDSPQAIKHGYSSPEESRDSPQATKHGYSSSEESTDDVQSMDTDDRNMVPTLKTSVLADLFTDEVVRKRSPKKSYRKRSRSPLGDTADDDGHSPIYSESQSSVSSPKKKYTSNHLTAGRCDTDNIKSPRKPPNLSILDEIFS